MIELGYMTDVFVSKTSEPEKRASKTVTDSKKKSAKNVKRDACDFSEVMRETQPTSNPLASFMVRPTGFRFDTQEKQEDVLLLLRRHVLTNVPWMLIVLAMALAPAALRVVPLLSPIPGRFQFMVIVLWYMLTLGYLLESFLTWYFNVYIITDERVVDVDFYSLIYKEVSSAKIENIEDLTYKMGGAVQSIFNFGTVYIQTAGEKREFDFEHVPRPDKVVQFLNELILEEEQERIDGRVR